MGYVCFIDRFNLGSNVNFLTFKPWRTRQATAGFHHAMQTRSRKRHRHRRIKDARDVNETQAQLLTHAHHDDINKARELLEGLDEATSEVTTGEPIRHAIRDGNFEMAQLFLDYGANVNSTDYWGKPLLHEVTWFFFGLPHNDPVLQAETNAQQEDSRKMVELLVKKGADVSIKDKDGWTVLHKAAYNGYVGVVRWLLEDAERLVADNDIGVDVFAKTNAGETAQRLAKLNAHHRASATAPHHQIVVMLEVAASQPKCVAFAMGLHPRLGEGSAVTDFKPELLRMVLELVLDRVE